MRVYPRWESLTTSEGSVGAYVRRAITNEYLSWRRRWSTRHIQLTDLGHPPEAPYDPWDGGRDEQLWQLMLRLPRQQRAAVVLRYYEGLNDVEIRGIAERTDAPADSTSVMMNRSTRTAASVSLAGAGLLLGVGLGLSGSATAAAAPSVTPATPVATSSQMPISALGTSLPTAAPTTLSAPGVYGTDAPTSLPAPGVYGIGGSRAGTIEVPAGTATSPDGGHGAPAWEIVGLSGAGVALLGGTGAALRRR